MALAKIDDLYPNYKEEIFGGEDIKSFSVYSQNNEKIGSVHDLLVDESGRFRYLVIDTGFWIFGKKVLLPVGRATVNYGEEKIYAKGLTKEQAESLPQYDDDMTVDYDYEERVRSIYRGEEYDRTATAASVNRDSYSYDTEPSLYNTDEANHQKLKLYEERLIANKERFRAGTVTVGKRVETETASVSVPVEKERIVVERTSPGTTEAVTPGEATFQEGEVARVEVYEETADIAKQAFVREEVSIKKEVEQEIVSANETVRREELELDTEGNPIIDRDL